jgi:hypothetical protein
MSRERTNPRETAQFSQANEAGGSSSIHAPREAGPHRSASSSFTSLSEKPEGLRVFDEAEPPKRLCIEYPVSALPDSSASKSSARDHSRAW